jgi:hypothetical protein
MADQQVPLVERVQDSFRRLSVSAAELNSESDRLNASISALESALKKLGLGISSWYQYNKETLGDGSGYWIESIGYTKMNSKWGLALSTRFGNDVDEDNVETWPFNESPRHLRIKALKFIPQLLDQLNKDAVDFSKSVSDGIAEVDMFTEAILCLTEVKPSAATPKPPARRSSSRPFRPHQVFRREDRGHDCILGCLV